MMWKTFVPLCPTERRQERQEHSCMYSNLLHMMVHKKYEILQKVVHKQGTKRSTRSNLLVELSFLCFQTRERARRYLLLPMRFSFISLVPYSSQRLIYERYKRVNYQKFNEIIHHVVLEVFVPNVRNDCYLAQCDDEVGPAIVFVFEIPYLFVLGL